MQLGNRDSVGADPLADFAVVAKLKPFRGKDIPFHPESFCVRAGELGAGEQARGL